MLSTCPLLCQEPFPSDDGDRALAGHQPRAQHTIQAQSSPPGSPCPPTTACATWSSAVMKLTSVDREGGRGSKQSKKKSPAHDLGRGFLEWPSLMPLMSRRSLSEGYMGRSPDSRIILLANAFPARTCQWLVQLAFVPAYSGASVRELHPLSASITHVAIWIEVAGETITLCGRCQAIFAS
jgi:hypothetical protein